MANVKVLVTNIEKTAGAQYAVLDLDRTETEGKLSIERASRRPTHGNVIQLPGAIGDICQVTVTRDDAHPHKFDMTVLAATLARVSPDPVLDYCLGNCEPYQKVCPAGTDPNCSQRVLQCVTPAPPPGPTPTLSGSKG
jgi:hypothetical protein